MTIDKKGNDSPRPFGFLPNDHTRDLIDVYLQGGVYALLINATSNEFATRDIVGGENRDWEGTPLQSIYDGLVKEYSPDKKKAYDRAAIEVGYLLKEVLLKDRRDFSHVDSSDRAKHYKWNK